MRWLGLALLLLSSACKRTAPNAAATEAGMRLRIAERQWEQRATNGLEPVEKTLEAVYGVQPDHPEVLWQLARLKITQGLVEPDRRASLYSFAEARALALRCLDAEPAFLQRRVELGWEPALEILSPAQRPCAAYGALAWARWMEVHGGAAGEIDLDTIDLLVQAITNTGAERERRVAVWAQAATGAAACMSRLAHDCDTVLADVARQAAANIQAAWRVARARAVEREWGAYWAACTAATTLQALWRGQCGRRRAGRRFWTTAG